VDTPETARAAFDRLAAEQCTAGAQHGRMFGHDGLTVDGHYYAFFDRDCLIVKLTQDDVAALVSAAGVTTAAHVSPSMQRTWSCVPADGTGRWRTLLNAARERIRGIG